MKMFVGALALIALAGCGDQGPWDGPVGTKMGVTASQLEKYVALSKGGDADPLGRTTYFSPQSPKNEAGADRYSYLIGGKSGLCEVGQWFQSINSTNSGFAKSLADKYGAPNKEAAPSWGVSWTAGEHKLDHDLESIRIKFSGEEPRISAYVKYTYKNLKNCK